MAKKGVLYFGSQEFAETIANTTSRTPNLVGVRVNVSLIKGWPSDPTPEE